MADGIILSVSAVNGHRALHIAYVDAQGEATERTILPYRVVSARDGRTYIHAYCELRGEERTFRTDRIRTVEVEKGTVPPERYLQDCKRLQYPVSGTVLATVMGLYDK